MWQTVDFTGIVVSAKMNLAEIIESPLSALVFCEGRRYATPLTKIEPVGAKMD